MARNEKNANVRISGHSDLVDQWVDDLWRLDDYAPSTVRVYARQVQSALDEVGPDVTSITTRALREVVKRRWSQGYAATTRRQLVASLRSFFAWCADEGIVERSPARRLRGPKVYSSEPDTLTRLETSRLVYGPQPGHLPKDPLEARDRVLVAIAYWCALRSEEPGLIEVESIDESAGYPSLQLERRKGAARDIRIQILDDMTAMMLQGYLIHHRLQLVDDPLAGPLFPSTRGRRAGNGLSERQVRRIFDSLRRQAGIRPRGRRMRFHLLRATWATHALELGADIRDVQQHLGHASVETTSQYDGRRNARKLSERVYRPLLSRPEPPPIARFADALGRQLEQAAGR